MAIYFLWSLFLLYPSGQTEATRLRASSTTAPDVVQRQQVLVGDTQRHPNDSATPEQVHIALASAKPRETYAVSVSWVTWVDSKSQVFWGREVDALTEAVTGNSTSYSVNFTNPHWPEYTSGRLHSATIEDLEPSGTFYYTCGDEDLALSTVRQFNTSGAMGPNQTITFGVLGDLEHGVTPLAYELGEIPGLRAMHSMHFLRGEKCVADSLFIVWARATIHSLRRSDPAVELVLHAGDLSYADCYEKRWDSFLRMLDPVASHIPWMVAAGNHEIEHGSVVGSVFAAYEHRFRMPAAGPAVRGVECGPGGGLEGNGTACGLGLGDMRVLEAATGEVDAGLHGEGVAEAVQNVRGAINPFRGPVETTGWPETEDDDVGESEVEHYYSCGPSEWAGTYDFGNSFYSFDVASVHVVVLNPYTATGEGSLQQSWLMADLGSTDRSLTPWVIAMFHCPWHNSNLSHQTERQALTAMRTMEPLLFEHKAALVISGHVHAYERSLPVLSGQLTEGAPVNVIVGGSGNKEYLDPDYYRLPEWSAFRNGTAYGAGFLSVMNSTTALWQWKSNDDEPVIHDSAWIFNPFSQERR